MLAAMSGVSVSTGLLLTVLLLFNQCGGRATEEPASGGAGGRAASGGTTANPDECAGAATDGGCGGEDGALEPYARLRTGCGYHPGVGRDAGPVSICERIR